LEVRFTPKKNNTQLDMYKSKGPHQGVSEQNKVRLWGEKTEV
jgi:hypothetical protein